MNTDSRRRRLKHFIIGLSALDSTRLLNASLRIVPMLAKLLLTFYAGRYLPLEELGTYGLVFAAVMILSSLLGQSFTYVIVREIVDVTPSEALVKMRDQLALYCLNYAALAAIVLLFSAMGFEPLRPSVLWLAVLLTAVEGIGSAVWNNMNALRQQVWSNVIFCVRSSVWIPPVIILGLYEPSFRNASVLLWGWACAGLTSFALVCYLWRQMPWNELIFSSVDWGWIVSGVRRSFPVWIGAVGLAAGIYFDRFIVERFLNLAEVGVITFYGTFTNALLALLQAGVLSFALPGLIGRYRGEEYQAFVSEAGQTIVQAAIVAAGAAFCFAALVPVLGLLTQRSAFTDYLGVFWVMLIGVWLRVAAEAFQTVLFSSHQDKPIWLGNLLFLVPAIGGNAILVPVLGLMGVGISSILSGAFLLCWRGVYVHSLVNRLSASQQNGRQPLSSTS